MAIQIPVGGSFKLVMSTKTNEDGPIIAGVSFGMSGSYLNDCLWVVIGDGNTNPVPGKTYKLTLSGLETTDDHDVNPTINTAGSYDGICRTREDFDPGTIWSDGVFGDGTPYVIYKAHTGELTGNIYDELVKYDELILTGAIGPEVVDWWLEED